MRAKEAKKILPKNEYEAFEAILVNQTSRMGAARLKQRATLSRRLRDKYRDLAKRQAASVRTRRTNETDTDIYDRRVRIFQSIIDQLEAELDKPRRQTAPRTKKPSRPKASMAAREQDTKSKKVLTDAKRRTRS